MKGSGYIPYNFILDHLIGIDIEIKPMFGCYGIYSGGKLCLFLIDREKPPIPRDGAANQNGIYVATTADYVYELKTIFTRAEFQLLKKKKVWIFIPAANALFEEYAIRACEMISAGDSRIGR